MLTFADMSTVESALEGKTESILNSCFNSVFFLPPELDIPEEEANLYTKTMVAMNVMLQALVRNCPNSRMREEMCSIFQALLHFFHSHHMHVRTRALSGILRMIVGFIDKDWYRTEDYKLIYESVIEVYFPILGELLGHLCLFSCGTDSTRAPATEALYRLYVFVKHNRSKRRWVGQLLSTPTSARVSCFWALLSLETMEPASSLSSFSLRSSFILPQLPLVPSTQHL
ncbi:uncharacterized protein [Excalfactoria chinensis]|uniref:uncharacterized protein n=1 Tax=Excalfactoria chinensis TaxID=46218 RepID=UPI003B3BB526